VEMLIRRSDRRLSSEYLRSLLAIQRRKQPRNSAASLPATQLELAQVSSDNYGELAASIAHEVNQPLTAVNNSPA